MSQGRIQPAELRLNRVVVQFAASGEGFPLVAGDMAQADARRTALHQT